MGNFVLIKLTNTMATIKEKVQDWIANGCDFDEGLQILTRNSNLRALIKHLGRGEATDDKREHLLYHLTQLADVKVEDPFVKSLPEPLVLRDDEQKPAILKEKNYPAEVVELKELKAKLYNDRAILHKKFHKIGTSNDQDSCLKRKEVKDQIQDITNQFTEADDKIQAIFDGIKNGGNSTETKPPVDNSGDDKKNESENQDKGKLSAEEAVALKQELTNNIAYISKNKENKKPKIVENVESRKKRNKAIEKLLKGIK